LSCWIRIRIQNADPDPGVKIAPKFVGKHVLFDNKMFFLHFRTKSLLKCSAQEKGPQKTAM
jgi:hypothetical protein